MGPDVEKCDCEDKSQCWEQCWEQCGDLGHSAEHVRVAQDEVDSIIRKKVDPAIKRAVVITRNERAIIDCVYSHIDRMFDVCPEVDSAEVILADFVEAVRPHILALDPRSK